MQLLKNDTVKQHGNHPSGTWGDAEQESGGVCRKLFDFIFYEFLNVYKSNLNSIFLDFGMQLLKNDTVKQHGNHPSGTWGDAEQESWWSLQKTI